MKSADLLRLTVKKRSENNISNLSDIKKSNYSNTRFSRRPKDSETKKYAQLNAKNGIIMCASPCIYAHNI